MVLFLFLESNRKKNVHDIFCYSHTAVLVLFWIKEILPLVCYNILSLGFIPPFSHLAVIACITDVLHGVLGAFPTGC